MMRFFVPILVTLLCLGTAYRLWPAFAGQPALSNFFITEDGYLMLTVARNIAIGNGMSVADGTIATNGVQPLATFLFAVPYWLTGGDKVTSLIGIHLIHAGTALAAVFAIRALAARGLAGVHQSPLWPWLVALLWFLGPLLLRHSMNGLETSLITLVAILTLLVFHQVLDGRDGMAARLSLGALCGLSVLARNDAVFLVTAIFLTWSIWELFVVRRRLVATILRLFPPGILSIAIAAPWLLNNVFRFGSIVPVSGSAQNLDVPFAANLPLLPVKLFEQAFPMLPIPGELETLPIVMAITAAAVIGCIAMLIWQLIQTGSSAARGLFFAYLAYGAALAAYYGLSFGAPHFLSRYLAPVAPPLILGALILVLALGRFLRRETTFGVLYGGISTVLILGLLGRALLPGVTQQGHAQVVAWATSNIDADTWVGAVQTGTLGYWHDRTLNLDGKVNPAALAARQTSGHVLDYVTDSEIDVIIDWAGVGDWVHHPGAQNGFSDAFALELKDDARNLAVMIRRPGPDGS